MKKRTPLVVLAFIAVAAGFFFLGRSSPSPAPDPVRAQVQTITAEPLPVITAAPVRSLPRETEPPARQQYVLNKKTKKFHKPNCSSVKQMKESNKIYSTSTREEIIADGYDPCGRCKP